MKVYVLMSSGLDEAKEVIYQVEGVYQFFDNAQAVANRLENDSKLTNPPEYSVQVREMGTEKVHLVWRRNPDRRWEICWPLGATKETALWEDEADGKPDPLARNWPRDE